MSPPHNQRSTKMVKEKHASSVTPSKEQNQGWSGVFWLSVFLLLEAGALFSVTSWQQATLGRYNDRLETAGHLLDQLEDECRIAGDVTEFSIGDGDGKHRERRQTLSGLFHDLLIAQEHVLMDVCKRRTDLCRAGPKGQQGEPGDNGTMGAAGAKGDMGNLGLRGEKGAPGPAGTAGSTGPQGPQGTKGDTGAKGAPGLNGTTGDPGPNGDPGAAGPPGPNGTRGDKGEKGDAGPAGTQGAKGEVGPKGEVGDAGPQGPTGDAGTPGIKGESDNGCLCYEMPTITGNFSDSISVSQHHKLVLTCNVSDPSLQITWQKSDGTPIPGNVQVTGNSISFEAMTSADEGAYECVGRSSIGNVTKSVDVTMSEQSQIDCDFELNTFCQWTNLQDDNFDWSLIRGPTSTAHTGPTVDHTRGDSAGYYAYIESSAPRLHNDYARLQSPVLDPSTAYCLNFWYHIYGQTLGSINVMIKKNGLVGSPIWTTNGPSEDLWHNAKIDIPAQNTPFSLILEGVRGLSYNGDAAIDDLSVVKGSCPP